MLKSDII